MSILVFFILVLSSYVAQNKQIEENLKVGYFSVLGLVVAIYILFSVI